MSDAVIKRSAAEFEAFRIQPGDTNRMALFVDPIRDNVPFVGFVEVFDPGGATPPNVHHEAHEVFFVLEGEGIATCAGASVPVRKGDFLSVAPGQHGHGAALVHHVHAAQRGLRGTCPLGHARATRRRRSFASDPLRIAMQHHLHAGASTCHWGYFDAARPAVLTV